MKKKMKSTHGAISVFLSIILVPCIAFTTLFVDLSRVKIAKDLVESAGDLALNSLLTNYDADLSEFYGMVTSCQNIDDFYKGSADYFIRLLKSQGLTDDEAKTLLAQADALVDNKEIADMLKMEIKTDTTSMIGPVVGANFGNATIVRDQIVDFMKYRAPINLVAGFLGELGASGKELEEQKENEKLTKEKKEFYKDENKMMEKAFDIYDQLRTYQNLGPSESKINTIISNVNSYPATYKQIHTALVKDIYNTSGLGDITKKVCRLTDFTSTAYNTTTKTSLSDIKTIMQDLGKAITNYKKAKTELENAFPTYDSNIYDIQYWAQNASTINSKLATLNTESSNILKNYVKLKNASEFKDDDATAAFNDTTKRVNFNGTQYNGYDGYADDQTYQWHYNKFDTQVMQIFNSVLSVNGSESSSDKYLKYIAIIQRISTNSANKDAINSDRHQINGESVNQNITDIYNQITADSATLQAFSDKLKNIDSDLDKLKTLLATMKTEFSQWESKANGMSTELANTDKATDLKEARNGDPSKGLIGIDDITEASINELKTRVVNMKKLYDDLIKNIDDMKYRNKKLKDIKNLTDVKNASGISASSIKQTKSELNSYADSSFGFTPASDPVASVTITNANHPDLNHNPKPTMWFWMVGKFRDQTKGDVDKEQEKYDNFKNNGDSKNKEDQTTPASINNNPMNAEGSVFNFGDGLGALVDLAVRLGTDFEGAIVGLRDSLFATEYVTSMFSSYTFESDQKYNKAVKAGTQTANTARKYDGQKIDKALMNGKITTDFGTLFETKRGWENVKIQDSLNYSLTSKPINATNNWGYRAEWEYILYGQGSSQSNINKALTQMYIIRFILNTPSGYLLFWNGTGDTTIAIKGISVPLSAATAGIIPEPLIRAILILVVVALESGNDVSILSNGFPVKFLKTGSKKPDEVEWAVALETIGGGIDDWIANGVSFPIISDTYKGFHVSYNQYLYTFLILGFESDKSSDMYNRTATLIQQNLNYIIKGKDGNVSDKWKKSKAIVYFNIEATIRVKPLMLSLPIASYSENPKDSVDWCTFTYKTSRGY
jgi:hypothetical protein